MGDTTISLGSETTLGDIIDAYPGVLEVLETFGIRIDPWTLIALRSPLSQLAEYSALRRPEELLAAIADVLERSSQAAASDPSNPRP